MRDMRRFPIVLAAAVLLLAASSSVASAHRSMRMSDTQLSLSCDLVEAEDGIVHFSAMVSQQHGSAAWLIFWQAPALPDDRPPTWVSLDGTVEMSADGSSLSAALDMYEYIEGSEEEPFPEPGAFVGQATVEATLVPVGDPQPYSYESSGSNARYLVEGVTQEYAVSGVATLPGELTFDLVGCTGFSDTSTSFATSPDAYVARSEGTFVSCYWENEGYSIGLNAYRDGESAGADMFLMDVNGEYYGIADELTLTDDSLDAALDIYRPAEPPAEEASAYAIGPGELVGSATVSASLEPTGDRHRFAEQFGWEKYRSRGEALAVNGEMSVAWPGGEVTLHLDAESCGAEAYVSWQHYATPNGTPSVKPVPNDLPEDALPMEIGESALVRDTGGASPEPEVPCSVVDPEVGEPVELPFGFTAWWTLEGTGGELTVDTAASDFDTVVGIYTVDGEGFVQVACVDDVVMGDTATTRASIIFGTDAGVTYFVQAGGYGYSSGRLEVDVR
jgi:hypothetical protein